MGRNPGSLPDECDFCDQTLDEDEDLEPLWVGDPPKPKSRQYQEIVPKSSMRVRNNKSDMVPRLLGLDVYEHKALFYAIQGHPWITYTHSPGVNVITPNLSIGELTIDNDDDPPMSVKGDVEYDNDRAAATITVKPEIELPEPDMLVCEYCYEEFSSDG